MWEYQLQDHIHHIFSFYITAEHLANCAAAFKTIVFFFSFHFHDASITLLNHAVQNDSAL